MIPALGQLALILALVIGLVQASVPLVGAARGRADWMAVARTAACAQALCVALAFGCLAASFVRHDFSVLYVASHSNTALPLVYRLSAVWAGHEGSLLLWLLMLNAWSVAVALGSRSLPQVLVARILAVMALIGIGFLAFTLSNSNPFVRLIPSPLDGADLNPLLQDPGMVLHPPMLYMGYVGFSVAFSFAIAALLGDQLDAAWARWTRPWTIAAWLFLTLGIALGSGWAYYELGWGGWWFWDPVENASFMPWLAGTALIHSLAVAEKRGSFKAWTVLLAIVAFSLSLLGTFLVRSGVLSSVHAFATDPRRGLFILCFLVLVTGGSLLLYAWRAPRIGLGQRFGTFSRESFLLLNNVFLAAAVGAMLLGTLYPLFVDALGAGKISVGPPYFNSVMGLLLSPLALLLGVGPLVHWKQDKAVGVMRRLAPALLFSLCAAGLTGVLCGRPSLATLGGLALAYWILASLCTDLWLRWRNPGTISQRLHRIPRATAGMMLAHLGVAVFIFGVTMVNSYESSRDVKMGRGDGTEIGGYRFVLEDLREVAGPNYQALRAQIAVTRDGKPVTTLYPEKRRYGRQENLMTEAAIDSNARRDLYISLGEPVDDGHWTLRVQHRPFIAWIWGGCLLMALGGALAASDRRYRRQNRKTGEAHRADLAEPAAIVPGKVVP